MFDAGKILDTQISLGDALAHLSSIAIVIAYIAKNHSTWNKIKERNDMLWRPFCEEHGLEYTSCEEKK